jgi:hypothetical protein
MALFNKLGGMFTDNPVNRVGPTGQPLIGGSNTMDLLTRGAGGLLGREVRGRPEQLTAALAQIDPKDPQKMTKMYGLIAELGEPPQQMAAMEKMKGLAQQRSALQQKEQYRNSLIEKANSVGMGDLSKQITNASDDEVRDLAKELNKRVIELAARGDDDKAGRIYLKGAGFNDAEITAQYGTDIPPIDELERIVTYGDKGSIKAFVGEDGNAKMYSVLGNKVLIDGAWTTASSSGLAPAPSQIQTQELDGIFGKMPDSMKELVNETVSNTIKQGQEASDTLAENARAQQLMDEGIFTGLGADAIVELARVGSFFGIDSPTLDNTQAFALERYAKVADIIQAYGAGTGLSNSDRIFALAQAGVPTYEKSTLERMLRIEREIAKFQLAQANKMIDKSVENGLLTTGAAELLQLGRSSVPQPTATLSPNAAKYIR